MEVGETGGDGMKIVVERYVAGFASFVDESWTYIFDVDVENMRGVEALKRRL